MVEAPLRVIVIGGTGVFGRRLVAGLLETTDFDIVVAARNGAGDASDSSRVTSRTLDVRAVTAGVLKCAGAFAVVDAAGPFQGSDYRLARAAPGRERWTRDFGGRRMASVLSASARAGGLVERFGPVSFELDLSVGPVGVLGMPGVSWRLGPLPLPRVFAPISIATERVDDEGRFCFDVELRLPLGLGRLVRYRGWLVDE